MEAALLILMILAVVLLGAVLFLLLRRDRSGALEQLRADTRRTVVESMSAMGSNLTTTVQALHQGVGDNIRSMGENIDLRLGGIDRHVTDRQEAMHRTVEQQMQTVNQRLAALETTNEQKLEALRQSMQTAMAEMRRENAEKLEEIRGAVDEKLQETLQKQITDSFQSVSRQLEQVYKGLGEMRTLASDVGGLKQVLSGVKTRGILGEIQLGAILEEILAPEQYDTNVVTIPGRTERVEFAVRLPGSDGEQVYLPIDSKFPGDTYAHLQEAQAAGDPAAAAEARKRLVTVLKLSAKDIRDKYVEVPYTTSFGILFLPFEGLYAEAVNLGMVETLQREYSVNVAGPSTMAALLNALQMGFRTLAIQKRSGEVWHVLGEVKTEFGKFEEVMAKMQNHLRQTSDDLDQLMGTRTRAIHRKLRDVQELEPGDAARLT